MEIANLYNIYKECSSVSTDSRNCTANALFFALKGDTFDGNQYALKALDSGCKYAVVDAVELKNRADCIYVDDSLKTLQQLAAYHRKTLGIPIIAITGTNGKTTTKELTAAVLSKKLKVRYTQGNLNNHIGVPLTLLAMTSNTEIGIVEMGANHIGEIAFLCTIAKPDYGLITNVGKAHLEGFGSLEGVMSAKGELYKYLFGKKAPVFVNADNHLLMKMIAEKEHIGYGTTLNASASGRNIHAAPLLQFEWKKRDAEVWENVETQLTGDYNFENAMAAICIGNYFDIAPRLINEALANYTPSNNRSQLVLTVRNKVLMDAYNANPSSMKVALDNFDKMTASRKILILGGMKELGDESYNEHKILMERIEKLNAATTYLVGSEFAPFDVHQQTCRTFESANLLIDYFKENPVTDALILVKGSRTNRLEDMMSVL
ncbi:MAG: UDP-N-acetylmuramoyl-tripeptide--D-alanyl-D-alanine ligase [Cytophagaceae bacterium]|jgi:UDP-N-acetylmuramoyl-tripeptide--D-alanyl-D-alanine ligase|nr:UDP-N-acetylmuramoyl-tripeptide--D-alanyl-D-alanine ligase [Cytophagaceae bacterium]